MLSARIGITLADIRVMPVEDYYTYLAVFDAEHKISRSLFNKRK